VIIHKGSQQTFQQGLRLSAYYRYFGRTSTIEA